MKRGTILGVAFLAVVLTALVGYGFTFMNGRTPPAADPGIQQRADEFSEQLAEERAAREAAALAARQVHLSFSPEQPFRVFYAGDSLTIGLHSSTEETAFRSIVTDHLEQFGEVEEIRSEKTEGVRYQVGNVGAIPEKIDLAIVALGTNDAGATDLEVFQDQYAALIDRIQADSPEVQMICAGTWGAEGAVRNSFDDAIEEICSAEGGKYVQWSDLFEPEETAGPEGRDTWQGVSDPFHPNDAGHRAIADRFIERIAVAEEEPTS